MADNLKDFQLELNSEGKVQCLQANGLPGRSFRDRVSSFRSGSNTNDIWMSTKNWKLCLKSVLGTGTYGQVWAGTLSTLEPTGWTVAKAVAIKFLSSKQPPEEAAGSCEFHKEFTTAAYLQFAFDRQVSIARLLSAGSASVFGLSTSPVAAPCFLADRYISDARDPILCMERVSISLHSFFHNFVLEREYKPRFNYSSWIYDKLVRSVLVMFSARVQHNDMHTAW